MTLEAELVAAQSYFGYPSSHVRFLRCQHDGASLQIAQIVSGSPTLVREGSLQCSVCSHRYPIVDGIVLMLEEEQLDAEGIHELRMRNEYIASPPDFPTTSWDECWEELEMAPTLAALDLSENLSLLEFACGAGRYTAHLAGRCRALLAVDFSLESLRALAKKIPAGIEIGLAQADITRLILSPGSFDRILSTTCLDNREQRMAMHRLASDALAEKGRYVYSAEFYNLRNRWLGVPRAQRYTEGGMLFCHLDRDEAIRETAPYFGRIKARPIQVSVPFTGRITYKWRMAIARILEKIPLACDLGALLLVQAETPLRVPKEGEYTTGNKLVKAVDRWYNKRRPHADTKGVST